MPAMSRSTTAGIPDWKTTCPRCRSELTTVRVSNELEIDIRPTDILIDHNERRTKRCHCTFCNMNWNEKFTRVWSERKEKE